MIVKPFKEDYMYTCIGLHGNDLVT